MLKVSSDVSRPLIPSTSFITGTGFIKCIPATTSGRLVTAAISVIEIEEVFEARIAPAFTISSSFLKISNLSSFFSVAASTTRSQFLRSPISKVAVILAKAALASSADHFPFSAPLSNCVLIKLCPKSKEFLNASKRIT